MHITVVSAAGMSYYSITGAYMSQVYGVEIGTYGFIVNVLREFFTVSTLPLLIRISKGSPIAAGASGNMDTMLELLRSLSALSLPCDAVYRNNTYISRANFAAGVAWVVYSLKDGGC